MLNIRITFNRENNDHKQLLQRIYAIGLMDSLFCVWNDLKNPKIGLNLIPNPL